MNPTLRRYLFSSLTTFVTVFIAVLSVQLSNGTSIMWTVSFWSSIGLAALRAAIKAVVESMSGQTGDAAP